jgi:hypothetical protein
MGLPSAIAIALYWRALWLPRPIAFPRRPRALVLGWRAAAFIPGRVLSRLRYVAAISILSIAKPATLFLARNLEAGARIFVRAARAPVASAILALRLTRAAREALFVRRSPETSSREPAHHGVGVPRLQLTQGREQLLFGAGAKCRRLAVEDDRPVRVAWRHDGS